MAGYTVYTRLFYSVSTSLHLHMHFLALFGAAGNLKNERRFEFMCCGNGDF